MSINLSYIKPKNTLSLAAHKCDLTNAIVVRVKEIDNHQALKFDNELLIFVCNCIENALTKKEIDKKEMCLDVFDKLFSLNVQDKAVISSSMDFLCNNKLVERIPSIQKYSAILSHYIKNKL